MSRDEALRIGEVARLTGLTVRTLHHYDERGLLVPSARSAGDYRLYDAHDLRRLLAIRHLKSLGLTLDQVADALADPGYDPADVLAAQIAAVRERLAAEQSLLERLERLQAGPGASWQDVVDAIALGERLQHPDPTVRVRAALDAPGSASLADLVAALRVEADPSVRETLTWAVVQHGDATSAVVAGLADEDPDVRLQLAHVLSKLHDPAAVPALVGLLDDPAPPVAAKAAFALGQLGGDDALAALLRQLGVGDVMHRDAVMGALARFGGPAVEPVAARLRDPDPVVRTHAADTLGELGERAGVAGLAVAVADEEVDVRVAALMALAAIPGDEAAQQLRRATESEDPATRLLAERLLSARGALAAARTADAGHAPGGPSQPR